MTLGVLFSTRFDLLTNNYLKLMRIGHFPKVVLLLAGTQLVCLALGMWIHYQFILSTSQWTTDQQQWNGLAVEAESLTTTWQLPAEPTPAQIQAALDRSALPGQSRAVVVDSSLQVAFTPSGSSENGWQPGRAVAFHASTDSQSEPTAGERGFVKTETGMHPGVLMPLGTAPYRLLVYSAFGGAAGTAPVLQSLPIAGGIALAWIGGLQTIAGYLILSRLQTTHNQAQAKADAEALRRSQDLVRTRDAIIFGLAKLAESRDVDTGHHLERISLYSTRLATALRKEPKYREMVTPAFVRLIGISSALHDIGKVGIRDAILLKTGKLTPAERKHIQTHSTIGGECLRMIERRLGASNFLEMAREIALYHHERWDGTGYPEGLAGYDIPLAARIVAIADVYDALSQKRIYRDALDHEVCVEFIREHAGTHFDPDLVDVFLEIEPQFREIARQYTAQRETLPVPPIMDMPVPEPTTESQTPVPSLALGSVSAAENGLLVAPALRSNL